MAFMPVLFKQKKIKKTCPDGWVDEREIGEHGGCYLFANNGKGVKSYLEPPPPSFSSAIL